VGPEAPLAAGITDSLVKHDINVFGPLYSGSRLESSKIFAKELMGEYDIPTADFRIFDDMDKVKEYLAGLGKYPCVVKAYGLAAGKGVIIAPDRQTAESAAEDMLVKKVFGKAGEKIIIEEFLQGEEASIIAITDGRDLLPLATSQDHKRAGEGDKGPNTGGMGAYSPAPVITEDLYGEIMETILRPTLEALKKENIDYRGVLYAGLMITEEGPKVLEYNVRFGDPEAQVIFPRMKADLPELLMAASRGDISGQKVEWDDSECVCVVLASGGYPGKYEKGKKITGIDRAREEGAMVFQAGTRAEGENILTSGGRVLNVAALGKDIGEARDKAYSAVEKVHFENMYYRKDIAHRALARNRDISE
jgi:phosphoribosylamine--glycine ligase